MMPGSGQRAAGIGPWTGGHLGIVMMSALGDAVHVLPLLHAIKQHAPDTKISWVLQPGPAAMVQGHPHVDDVIIFRRDRGLAAYREVARELKKRPFDLLLALQVYFKAGIVTALANSRIKLGFDRARARDLNWLFTTHRIPPHPQQHVQDQYFEFLDAMGVPHGDPVWHLAPTADEKAAAQTIIGAATRAAPAVPGAPSAGAPSAGAASAGAPSAGAPLVGAPLVGFVVATSKPAKNWMPERYAALALRLRAEHNARVVLLGGNMPIERAARDVIMREAAAAQPIDALNSGLRTLIGLLDACDVVVSSDTGPYHMCVAMNKPVVGLYGYTNPKRVGPYRRFQDLLIDAYGDPGEDYPVNMEYRHNRMDRISVDMVFDKVAKAIGQADLRK
jgi:heptosyltransferase I